MKWIATALLAAWATMAAPQRVVLLEELVRVEAMERKTVVLFPLQQQGAQLEAKFNSKRGGEGVRLLVYARGETTPLAESPYELADTLKVPLDREREYRVEIENLRQRLGHAVVDVEITLTFGSRPATTSAEPRMLDPQRKLYTIAASLSIFGLILAYSAIRLTPPILARWRGQR